MENVDRNKITRKSNIELLRIIAMILIVGYHFSFLIGFDFTTETITVNRLWILFLEMGGKLGVNIFVLISGYFLINSPKIKTSKVLKLWLQVVTYTILTFIILLIIRIRPRGAEEVVKNILPITSRHYWFASTYFVLYLISPYINMFLKSIDKKTYQRILVLFTFCWCVIPTILKSTFECNDLIWFVYLYSLSGYFRLYINEDKINSKKYIGFSLIVLILSYFLVIIFEILGRKISIFDNINYFHRMQSLPMMLAAVFIFLGFLKIDIGYKKFINVVAESTFGVYLIHENMYIKLLLWKVIFKNALYMENVILISYSITAIIIVFASCSAIELFRIYVFERHYMKFVDKIAKHIDNVIEQFFSLKYFEK